MLNIVDIGKSSRCSIVNKENDEPRSREETPLRLRNKNRAAGGSGLKDRDNIEEVTLRLVPMNGKSNQKDKIGNGLVKTEEPMQAVTRLPPRQLPETNSRNGPQQRLAPVSISHSQPPQVKGFATYNSSLNSPKRTTGQVIEARLGMNDVSKSSQVGFLGIGSNFKLR